MFEILLLLAAAFSGHEVAANIDTVATDANAPPAVHSVVEAPATALNPIIRVADATSVENDPDAVAAINRVSDFYDTTPPSTPRTREQHAHEQGKRAAAPTDTHDASTESRTDPTRSVLGPHLVGSTENYVSDGQRVVIEVLRPDDAEQHPAVLILHGASGVGDGAFYRGTAEIFAERGYVTFLPHYLAATRAARIKAAAAHGKHPPKRPPEGSIRAGFPQQEQILRGAVDYMARSPYVDSTRIGVFGLSLGGFHALTLSSTDGRIAAVVDMSGALFGNVVPESNHIAPTLELHGAIDPIVPVARARELAATLQRMGVPHELKIYPNQGHFLRGKAQQDALERAAMFFGTYLTPSETSHAARSTKNDVE
jgi:dienelactone hydrolase